MPSRSLIHLLIAVVAALLFIPGLGAVHLFDWDEINFAEIAREMLVTGDWLQPRIDYLPFHEKPPLFIWMQAITMHLFGVGEFAARLPNALCGIATLIILYRIGEQLKGRVFGMLWALAYLGSILPHLYFRSGIIDPWFNLFIFLGIHTIISLARRDAAQAISDNKGSASRVLLAGLFLGLAVLTKGPVGLLIPGLVMAVYWLRGGGRSYLRWRQLMFIAIGVVVTAGCWALVDLVRNGPDFMQAFFWRQVAMLTTEDAGHGGFLGYHFVVLLLGCFPASVFALQELIHPTRSEERAHNDHRRWMVILFWVVLILFSIVQTKIVHYSSLCYFPLTYLAALKLEKSWRDRNSFGWSRWLLGGLGTLIAFVFLIVPFFGMHIDMIAPLFDADPFARANLKAEVDWTGMETLAGSFLLGMMLLAHWFHGKARYRQAIITVFGGTALFVTMTLFFFINHIEGYSQRAAVAFFEERQGEACHVITKNYKSYAQLFYTRKPEVNDPRWHDEEWLLYGDIEQPVYVVCKITAVDEVSSIRTLKELYRKNGFVFFKRDPA